ncbi:MAG: acyl-CoA/acyl-ACP dehydrogenase [Caulobacteraceae bacterium]|nr:acyl-CoA/acyl-ACP dehydrogenase [Caulobacteraceae bacterium]
MDFEFSAEQQQLKEQARRYLADKCPTTAVRAILEGSEPFDRALWQGLGEMGFLGAAIPEEYGGLGLGYLELCVIAEELGRALAPVPVSSSIFLVAEILKAAGSEEQKQKWLPKLASGEVIGTLASVEATGSVRPSNVALSAKAGTLTGAKSPVLDGDIADIAIVLARHAPGKDAQGLSLYLVDLNQSGIERTVLDTIDPSRSQAKITFNGAAAELVGAAGDGWRLYEEALDRAAILTGFEQIGGADRALEMGRDYALQRFAFGRAIGSFQAIKHMLADMYVSATLARSNGYFGAYALSTGSADLAEAAATMRVSSTKAFQHCAKNNIQVHGGMGFTWAMDCHLYYRRSNLLAVSLGGLNEWEDKLIDRLRAKNAA